MTRCLSEGWPGPKHAPTFEAGYCLRPSLPPLTMSQPYSHARTASDIQTSLLLGLPEQSLNPPPSPSLDSHGFALIGGQGDEPAREAWERKMGPNEVSYFLPSRAEGVNDMSVSPLFFPSSLSLAIISHPSL